ncbi:MAG TPA: TonB-dependent receptor [Gemmatimonadales bacterium]|nr:TonB-dependent receptor [Gemmatimonadales bacterium]
MRTHVVLAFAMTVCLAQSGQSQEESGRVLGRVVVEGGVPAAGVRVEAQGTSMLGLRRETTDARGYYRLVGLPVGSYRLRLSLIGYRPVAIDSVTVLLGRATTIGDVALQPAAVELGEIVVTAEQALVDVSSAATATNITAEQFTNFPTDRNFRSIVSLTPQANPTLLPQDDVNIAGGTGPENAYFLDGVNITDPKVGSTISILPYNFVRELQVKAGGYEAEYGKATGGIINVITPTGGDQFAGQVFGFYTGSGLSASPRFVLATAEESRSSNYDFGGSLGGPIVRQHLWFFAAYNPSFQRQRVTLPGVDLPDETHTQHLFATKLSWRASPETDVSVIVHGDPGKHRRIVLNRVPFETLLNTDAAVEDNTESGTTLAALVRRRLGDRGQVELSVARYSHGSRLESPTERGRTEPTFWDVPAGTFEGGYGAFQKFSRKRESVRASFATTLGRHDVKTGVEYERNRYEELTNASGEPGSPQGFIRKDNDTSYFLLHVKSNVSVRNRVPTAYLQDSWRVTDRLVLNAGLRWDAQYLTAATGESAQSFGGEWQPRLGISYALGRQGGHKVFGSLGRFYEQIPLNLSLFYYNNGTSNVQLHFDHDPRVDPTGGDTTFAVFVPQIEPRRDLEGQSYDELTLGYEGTVGRNLRAGLRGVVRRLRWAVDDAFNPGENAFQLGNPGRGNLAFVPKAVRHYSALVFTLEKPGGGHFDFLASYVLSRTSGNYPGLYDVQQIDPAPFPNSGIAFDFPELYTNSSGLLPNDRPHLVKFAGSYRFDAGLSLGIVTSWESGLPRNEFGAATVGFPYNVFLRPRGSAGRTPSVFDLNLRLAYTLPVWSGGARPKVCLDLFHLTNSRAAVREDDVHYLALDAAGNQTTINPGYNRGLNFQPPMSARLGLTLDFGGMP